MIWDAKSKSYLNPKRILRNWEAETSILVVVSMKKMILTTNINNNNNMLRWIHSFIPSFILFIFNLIITLTSIYIIIWYFFGYEKNLDFWIFIRKLYIFIPETRIVQMIPNQNVIIRKRITHKFILIVITRNCCQIVLRDYSTNFICMLLQFVSWNRFRFKIRNIITHLKTRISKNLQVTCIPTLNNKIILFILYCEHKRLNSSKAGTLFSLSRFLKSSHNLISFVSSNSSSHFSKVTGFGSTWPPPWRIRKVCKESTYVISISNPAYLFWKYCAFVTSLARCNQILCDFFWQENIKTLTNNIINIK